MTWSDHPAWQGSNRRSRLPPDWPRRRAAVLARDHHTCYRCGRAATEVDHVVAGDDHRLSQLAAICQTCHLEKSAREGSAAANAKRWQRDSTRRPPEQHPGLLW